MGFECLALLIAATWMLREGDLSFYDTSLNMMENQDYLRRSVNTQTDVDPLYENALDIVNSFETIQKYWKRVERTNQILLGCTLSLALILVLRRF